ncbi:MAG TPA: hypothetical protein VL199_21130 [Burkholderiales bacterium]|nr:hypothetical protein [Burkholderiales bacterium]
MIPQRLGQVWLYHGGTTVETLLRPHDEVNRTEPAEGPVSDPIQL